MFHLSLFFFFFFNDTATTEIYTLSLHDALPIWVPLFVEELTKMVLESGLLQERDDRYVLTGPLPPLAIPTTLHDSPAAAGARSDRKSTRLNSSHLVISYAVFCLKKKKENQ